MILLQLNLEINVRNVAVLKDLDGHIDKMMDIVMDFQPVDHAVLCQNEIALYNMWYDLWRYNKLGKAR